MTPDRTYWSPGDRPGTLDHARALARSIAESPYQSAGVLAALAAAATLHPILGLASAATGAAFLACRPKPQGEPLYRTPDQRDRFAKGAYALDLGLDPATGRSVRLDRDEATMHMLLLGETGSAKTECLLGFAEGVIASGSGTLFVDGKGDCSLVEKLGTIAANYGRADDLLVLDLLRSREAPDALRNTFNPFAHGDAEALAELILDIAYGSDHRRRDLRVDLLLRGILRHLVALRAQGESFGVQSLQAHLSLGVVVGLSTAPEAQDCVRDALRRYLAGLAGYNAERGSRQNASATEAHAQVLAGLLPVLALIADACDHVIVDGQGEIDLADAVRNRRIVVVTLPVLLKAGAMGEALGRVVSASLKCLLTALVPEPEPGRVAQIVPGESGAPFMVILDDVGHYAVEGLALLAARARHSSLSMIYASEDMPSLLRDGGIEASSIVANTVTKAFLGQGSGPVPDWHASPRGTVAATDPLARPGKSGDLLVDFKSEKLFLRARHPMPLRRLPLRANRLLPLPPATLPAGDAR